MKSGKPNLEIVQRHVLIEGRVQGVGFRAWVLAQAKPFEGLKGFVQNLPDGRVEVVFQGPEQDVLQLVSLCSKGPLLGKVSKLTVIEESPDLALHAFELRRA